MNYFIFEHDKQEEFFLFIEDDLLRLPLFLFIGDYILDILLIEFCLPFLYLHMFIFFFILILLLFIGFYLNGCLLLLLILTVLLLNTLFVNLLFNFRDTIVLDFIDILDYLFGVNT